MKLSHIGHTIQEFKIINSTNLYATAQIRLGKGIHGIVYRADEQLEGRGQRGKKWLSQAGESILMSVVLQPTKLASSQHFRLIAAIALGVIDYLKSQHEDGWKIKWPNDIYWNDRKAGGVLIENTFMAGKWEWSVVGIGLNLNAPSFHPELPNPVSLKIITGEYYEPAIECEKLCGFLEKRWQQLNRSMAWKNMLEEYNDLLYARNSYQRFRKENMVAELLVNHVTAEGQLVCGEAEEYLFDFGEVEWIMPDGR